MSTYELQHKHGPECAPITCPCTADDKIPHLFPDDHRELDEVGIYCLKCKDWCQQY